MSESQDSSLDCSIDSTRLSEIQPFTVYDIPEDIVAYDGTNEELTNLLSSLTCSPMEVLNKLMEHYEELNQINPSGKEFCSVTSKKLEMLKRNYLIKQAQEKSEAQPA
jgi:hypothetical protein